MTDIKTLLIIEKDMARMRDDPDLALIFANMDAWREAHPCECEAICTCDQKEDS